jgi:hypothetical protein
MIWKEGSFQFLGILDLLSIIVWFVIIMSLINSSVEKNKDKDYYTYYRRAAYVKIFSAIVFSIIYIINYSGGDSTAYWDTAQKLNNLFWHNPSLFFSELFNSDPERIRYMAFDIQNTGLPPNWIYKEDEAWFAAKVMTLLTFITFKSYFAMTLICSYISFKATWLLFEIALKFNVTSIRNTAIGVLFLPSTAFWCTGITKDMLIYSSVVFLFVQIFTYLDPLNFKLKRNLTLTILSIYVVLYVRDFMLIAVLAPIVMAIGVRLTNKQSNSFSKFFIQLFIYGIIIFAMISFFSSEKAMEFSTEAQLIQSDLKNNTTYGTNKYDLGISDFTPFGMIKSMPISIYTAFYRPYLWEADSLFIQISALETLIFMILTIRFLFVSNVIAKFNKIRNNEFLIGALVFSIILGFFAGYTSGLFGVLVRFKSPLLPFLFLVLTFQPNKVGNETEEQITSK